MFWNAVGVPAVHELEVRWEWCEELAGRNPHTSQATQVTEVDLTDIVSLHVSDAARRVVVEENFWRVVYAVYLVNKDKESFAGGEDNHLGSA